MITRAEREQARRRVDLVLPGSDYLKTPLIWRKPPKIRRRCGATTPSLPTFKSAGASQSGTGALTVAWPTHVTNDVALLVVVSQNETITLTTANGFAAVGTQQNSGGVTLPASLAVFWARATSGAMASPVIAANTLNKYARIYTFSGVSKDGTAFDVNAAGTNATGTTAPSVASTATLQQLDLIVAIVGYDVASATPQASAPTNANLSNISFTGDESTLLGGGAAVITGGWAAGGDYGATTATLASSSNVACLSVALKPQWVIDQASGKAFPAGVNEWTDFIAASGLTGLVSTPTLLYLMQESATPLAESVTGTVTLAAGGTGLSYQNAVTGYTRKSLKTTSATAGRWSSTDTSLPDISVTSAFWLLVGQVDTVDVAGRGFSQFGTTTSCRIDTLTAPNRFRVVSGANTLAGGSTLSGVQPFGLKCDHTGSKVVCYTDQEKASPTFSATMTGKQLGAGGIASVSSANEYLYGVFWSGSAAEMSDQTVHDLYVSLGFSPAWGIAVEDDTYQTFGAQVPFRGFQFYPFADKDEIPAGKLFGEADELMVAPMATWTPIFSNESYQFNDPDEIPAGKLFGQPEEMMPAPLATWMPEPVFQEDYPFKDPEEIPATTLFGEADEMMPAPLATWAFPPPLANFAFEDIDDVPSAVVTTALDDGAAPGTPTIAAIPTLSYQFNDPEELSAGALSGQPDEDHPAPLAVFTAIPQSLRDKFQDPEELSAGALRGEPDEDHPAPLALFTAIPQIQHDRFQDPEELTAGALSGQPDEDHPTPLAVFTVIVQSQRDKFADQEELTAGALSGQPDEDHVAPVATHRVIQQNLRDKFQDPEELTANTLRGQPDEDHVAPVATHVAIFQNRRDRFQDPEELTAGALSGQPDEDHVAPMATHAPARNIWEKFADVEELPAGDLLGQPDEDHWSSGVSPTSHAMSPRAVSVEIETIVLPLPIWDDSYWIANPHRIFEMRVDLDVDVTIIIPVVLVPFRLDHVEIEDLSLSALAILDVPFADLDDLSSTASAYVTLRTFPTPRPVVVAERTYSQRADLNYEGPSSDVDQLDSQQGDASDVSNTALAEILEN